MARTTDEQRPDTFVRSWASVERGPSVVVWEITLECNLSCKHCGSRAGHARQNELTTQECLSIIEQLRANNVKEVALIGGEAYLRPDWSEIAGAITAAGMICTMVTGGLGFDAWTLQQARESGIRRISVSIDGLEGSHNALRGSVKSFDSAVKTARMISNSGDISLGINSQLNKMSIASLFDIATLVADVGAHAWQVQITVPLGRAADRPHLVLQPYEMLELITTLRQVNASVLVPAGVRLFLGNNVGYFNDFDNGPGQTVSVGAELRSAWTGCKAGQAVLGIEADGTLKGCPSLPTAAYSAGNLRRDNLENLLSGQGKVHEIARRDIDDLWGFCRSCEYAETCMGGCTWTAHALFGRSGNNPYCYHRAETMRAHGLQEMIVMSERAPGDPFDHGKFEIALVPVPVAPTAQPAASDMDARQYLRKFNQR